jgi:hypothetical protein
MAELFRVDQRLMIAEGANEKNCEQMMDLDLTKKAIRQHWN